MPYGNESAFRGFPKMTEMALNENLRTVSVDGVTQRLTKREFAILRVLAGRQGHVVGWSDLLGFIWGTNEPDKLRALRVWVHSLRQKLEPNPAFPALIMTMWGEGMYLNERVSITQPLSEAAATAA